MAITLAPESIEAIERIPADQNLAHELGHKILVNIVGPTAVGKSSLMDRVCELAPGFGRVVGFTTRPQRTGEPDETYRFLPHTQSTVDDIEAKLASGSLVQLAVHPTTGYLYGSEVSDYPATYNMKDMLYSEVEHMQRLPFGYSLTLSVAVESEYWQEWFLSRYQANPDQTDSLKRLDEAYQSLKWSRNDIDTLWVQNYPDDLTRSAKKIIEMAQGGTGSDKDARDLVPHMQHAIPKLRALVMEAAA